jgi:heptosyltransferase-2
MFESCKKILIIRLSSLGDVLLTTPLIRSIKKNYPSLEIDFIVRRDFKDVLINNPYLTKLFYFERNDNQNKRLSEELKSRSYDLVIDLQNNFRSRKIYLGIRAKKLRFKKQTIKKLFLVYLKINRLKHLPPIPHRYAETIPDFVLDDEGLDLISTNQSSPLFSSSDKWIGFCPGSKHFTKKWLADYFIQLGYKLNEEGYKIAVFGGAEDEGICKLIFENTPISINLCYGNNLLQTAADMKKCIAVVCNDSGLMHTACAVKVPVAAIFGSTVKEFGFIPYKNKNLILENNSLTCRPCSHIGKDKCPKKHFKCMMEITPELVFEKLKQLINS